MSKQVLIWGAAIALIFTVWAPMAEAGPIDAGIRAGRGNNAKALSRAVRSGSHARQRAVANNVGRNVARSAARGNVARNIARNAGRGDVARNVNRNVAARGAGKSNTPILDAIRANNGYRGYGNYGNYGYGNGIGNGQILNEVGRIRDRNNFLDYIEDREDNYYDQQRAEVIAGAVVNVVGILADAQRDKYRYQSGYGGTQVVQQAPAQGHYQTQRVEVQPARYESQRVWVPEQRDPRSGHIIEGHYEIHKVYVPPVYQETQVWVQY